MKNQEILNQMYNSMLEMEKEVEEKVFIRVIKKIISKISKTIGVTSATIAFMSMIFEVIIIICDFQDKVNIMNTIDKSIPVAVVFIATMIIHGIFLEIYRKL